MFPAYIVILRNRCTDLILVLWIATNIIETHAMILIGVSASIDILILSDKATVVTPICNAPTIKWLGATLEPSTAATDSAIILTEPVVSYPPVCKEIIFVMRKRLDTQVL